jgi:hypothetical protein
MNERIDNLLYQAGLTAQGCWDELGTYEQEAIEKFAELIVRECAEILMKPEYAMNHPEELSDYNKGWVNGRLLGIEHINEYFGIEE